MAYVQAIDSNGKVVDRTLRPTPGSSFMLGGNIGTSATVTANSIVRIAAIGEGIRIRFNNSFPGTATATDCHIPSGVVEYFRVDSSFTTIYKLERRDAYSAGTATIDVME